MDPTLAAAGSLATLAGLGHSYHGERYLLIPLLRRSGLPVSPFGDERFTALVLRGVWHFTSLILWTAAALFFLFAFEAVDGGRAAVATMAASFSALGLLALVASRGRHYAWLLGSAIAALAWWSVI